MTKKKNLKKKGLIIVNTGDGKGKTTAALGIMLRASGQKMRSCMIQFIKDKKGRFGEHIAAEQLNLEIVTTGDGFTWKSRDIDHSAELARHGWEIAKQKIQSGNYDIVVLDEFTYPLNFGWIPFDEFKEWITHFKPASMHLVITGRNAREELIELADLVTEMTALKHSYNEDIPAQRGIEF